MIIKTIRKTLLLLLAVLMLSACSQTATPATTTKQPAGSTTAAQTTTTAAATTTQPAVNVVPNLPDPAGWAASLKFDVKDYPRVDGSTATLPLAIYMRSKITGATLEDSTAATRFTTTGPSYLALANNETDLLVVYEAPEEIKQQLTQQNAKLLMKPIGLDALVFLTNEGNPVSSLTSAQIIDIYTGKITNWNQVGGPDSPIIAYQRISNSGSQALMQKLVMQKIKMMDAPESLKPAEMDGLVDDIANYSNTNNALGYSVYYYVRNMYAVPGIKLLAVNGVAPNADTIASNQYPYINPFYAVIREDEPADSPARKLFNWLTGSEGSQAVKDAGYVPPQS
jgi:phosphate transport system substrate-binding protein